MPYNFDFSKRLSDDIKTITISPEGWVNPIIIEYCSAQARQFDTMISVCWRVKGTSHTFTIYENRLNKISNGNYADHFKETLELFREDYISWFTDEKYKGCEWRDEYKKQFEKFIIL